MVDVTLVVRETDQGEFHYDLWVGDKGRGDAAKQKAPAEAEASLDTAHGATRGSGQLAGNKAKSGKKM